MADALVLVGLLLVAFAGGAFGAALGAYPAFALTGFVVVAGEAARVAGGAQAGPGTVGPGALGTAAVTASVGLGPAFGPHVVFGGGAAAAAYASRKGYLDTGFDYYEAKNVTDSLGGRADVLLVGGAFGVLGLLLAGLSAGTLGSAGDLPWPGVPWDPIMASIVLSAFLHRLAFGYPLVGNVRGDVLDMSPYERGERRRPVADRSVDEEGSGDAEAGSGGVGPEADAAGRYVVEPWLPHQSGWAGVAVLGAAVGVFGAFVAYATGSALLAFGIAAASTILLSLGVERAPVTHHMALPASVLVVGLAGGASDPSAVADALALPVAVAAGAVAGSVAGVVGELAGRVLYAHADTHLDPPAASIVLTSLLIGLLDVLGLVSQTAIPVP
ncbi:MAG: hypothetical protein V5A62_00355 [Haloarculaceae archaeon]